MIEIWNDEHPIIGSQLNKTFHEINMMTAPAFRQWAEDVRRYLGKCWKGNGIPPHNGMPLEDIELELRRLSTHRTYDFLERDQATYERDVIVPDSRYGSFLRCLFTNMDKSGDGNQDGLSVYDFLTASKSTRSGIRITSKWYRQLERNVKRDSLYVYSHVLNKDSPLALAAPNGCEWITLFRAAGDREIAFWVEAVEHKAGRRELTISSDDLKRLKRARLVNARQIVNVMGRHAKRYRLRTYKRNQRIFPHIFL